MQPNIIKVDMEKRTRLKHCFVSTGDGKKMCILTNKYGLKCRKVLNERPSNLKRHVETIHKQVYDCLVECDKTKKRNSVGSEYKRIADDVPDSMVTCEIFVPEFNNSNNELILSNSALVTRLDPRLTEHELFPKTAASSSIRKMSQKQTSKRSYQQRSSSYKRNFGTPTPGQHSPLPMPMMADRNNGSSFTRTTYRSEISTSGGGASTSGAGFSGGASSSYSTSGAGLGEERITSMRSIPVASAPVNMSEINQMASSMGSDFQMMRMNEKSEMQTLNTRLAGFIQKVRALEQANKVLEVKLEQLQSINPERIGAMYEDELARLRAQIEELQHDKANLRLQLDNAYLEIEKINNKLEEEIVTRREIEEDLNNARKDCDEATLGRLDLESRIKALQEEIEFLNRVHNEEVAELHSRLRNTEVRIDTAPGPDLEALLEEMRQQYENMNKKNHANTERLFQEKVTGLQEAAVRNDQALRGARQEVNEVRKEMQSITFEMEALRGTNDALRRNIGELEDRYNRDVADYQETIMSMQNECDDLKKKMAEHLRQYQDLMGVKVALDMEISMYRKLLEGEETRLSESVEKIKQAQYKYTNQGASTSSGASNSSMMMQGGSSQMKQSDVDELETITKKKLVVTTIETKDGKVISETEDVRELNG